MTADPQSPEYWSRLGASLVEVGALRDGEHYTLLNKVPSASGEISTTRIQVVPIFDYITNANDGLVCPGLIQLLCPVAPVDKLHSADLQARCSELEWDFPLKILNNHWFVCLVLPLQVEDAFGLVLDAAKKLSQATGALLSCLNSAEEAREPKAKFCSNCGNSLIAIAKFCSYCGSLI